jgi:hypothetical protein
MVPLGKSPMKPQLTQSEFRFVTARTFAAIVASVENAANVALPIGQRDGSRRGTDRGDRMIQRRKARRSKVAARTFFAN